jgi:hypothetical protein
VLFSVTSGLMITSVAFMGLSYARIFSSPARNIDRTTLTTVSQLNVFDILQNRTLLTTRAGLEKILA